MTARPSFRQALEQKGRVYNALLLRHVVVRYGRENLGFLWIFIEPMLLCVGVMGVWTLTKGTAEHGLALSAIVFTGYMPLTLWRHMTNSMGYVMRAGKWLTNYRGITLLDVILSRLFVEFIGATGASIIVYLVLNTIGVLPDVYDWTAVLQGWMLMGALGFGAGMLIAGLVEANELGEHFIPVLQYLMLPFSGCFFLLNWLPDSAKEALLWVPFPHAFELIRGGYFGPSVPTYSFPLYAFGWAVLSAGVGFLIVERVKDHIKS